MVFLRKLFAVVFLLLPANCFGDIIVAFTSFEESSVATRYTTNPFPSGDTGRTFTPGGGDTELGFTTSFVDSRGLGTTGTIFSGDGNDFAGVTNAAALPSANNISSDPSGITGINYFAVDDADGRVELIIQYDATGRKGTKLHFDWAASVTTYEADDFLTLEVSDADTTSTLFSAGAAALGANGGTFQTETFALEANGFTELITFRFGFDNNAAAEDFFLDNVTITAVPEPTSIGLLGALAGGFFFNRVRKRRKKARENKDEDSK